MKKLLNKKVNAIADCGDYKNMRIEGILLFNTPTQQYLVKTDTRTISVKIETIKEL